MIVVSNTSPLNYFVLIGAVDVLPQLFGLVLVPRSVATELSRPAAPEAVRDWIARPPWLEIASPKAIDWTIPLDEGERDAVCLAQERSAGLILLDDLRARGIAQGRGLEVTGTVGVLEAAAERGLIGFEEAIVRLRGTTYRIADEIIEEARERIRTLSERKSREEERCVRQTTGDPSGLGPDARVPGLSRSTPE